MKREKFLWPLSQSHHRALLASKKVKEALSAADPKREKACVEETAAELQKFYQEELRPHFWDEEKMLALYEGHMGREEPEPDRVRKEHRLLEFLLAQATKPSLLSFAETLANHVRFEEDVVFGRIEKILDDAEKKALGGLLEQGPVSCAAKPA